MYKFIINLALTAASFMGFGAVAQVVTTIAPKDITVVLVHGAFAESSSWNAVISKLAAMGYSVIAVANPLRGLRIDSDYLGAVLGNIKGPVVLVGHSYGGSVITIAANGHPNVRALVYIDGLAPDSGESAATISTQFPGSTSGLRSGTTRYAP